MITKASLTKWSPLPDTPSVPVGIFTEDRRLCSKGDIFSGNVSMGGQPCVCGWATARVSVPDLRTDVASDGNSDPNSRHMLGRKKTSRYNNCIPFLQGGPSAEGPQAGHAMEAREVRRAAEQRPRKFSQLQSTLWAAYVPTVFGPPPCSVNFCCQLGST